MKYLWIALFLLSSPISNAFTLNGSSNLLGWDRDELLLSINLVACDQLGAGVRSRVFDAIGKAVDLWNAVSTSGIIVSRGPETPTTPTEAYNKLAVDSPVIACDSDLAGTLGFSAQSDTNNIAGVGIGLAKESGLRINYGYLLLNATPGQAANMSNLDDVVLSVVIAHEIGHVLGLGHTEDTSALMFFKASDKTELGLSQDDIDGVTYLYARGEFLGGAGLFGCGSLSMLRKGRSDGEPDGSSDDDFWGGGGAAQLAGFFLICGIITLLMRRRRDVPVSVYH